MDCKPLIDYISRHVSLTDSEQALLCSKVQSRKYLKGQYVVQQGDICRFESFVLSGCLRTFSVDKNGKEHIAMFGIEDWWVGDLGSFIAQGPANYNVQCIENVELLQLSYEDLNYLYNKIPKLERFFRIIIQNAFIASEKRTLNNFKLTAKEKYLLFRKQYPLIEQRVPQYMIASYLGITKEFLSKIRQDLILGQ